MGRRAEKRERNGGEETEGDQRERGDTPGRTTANSFADVISITAQLESLNSN